MDLWVADATKRALPSNSGPVSPGPPHERHSSEHPTTSRLAHSNYSINNTPSETQFPTGTPDGWGDLWGSCDPFDVTRSKRIRKTDTIIDPLSTDALQTEATVMSQDESEGIANHVPWYAQRWAHGAHPPSQATTDASNGIVVKTEFEDFQSSSDGQSSPEIIDLESPADSSLSGLPNASRTTTKLVTHEGSDIDSDYYDELALKNIEPAKRDIPNDEELDEPVRTLINEVQSAMDDEIDCLGVSSDFVWVDNFETFNGKREEFSGPAPGSVKEYDTPYDAFNDIWSDDIMAHIVEETNRYAKQCIEHRVAQGSVKPSSRVRKWRDTDINELYTLFAVFIYMGLDKREAESDYWRLSGCLEMPQFRQLMTSSRYILLNKFLHFVDNCDEKRPSAAPARLRKLAPVISHLNNKFSTLYNIEQNVTIDESLSLFNGREPWARAIQTQPSRLAIRSYELCEFLSGYIYKFDLYTGTDSDKSLSSDLGRKSVKILLELLKGLHNRGHCVAMDNFYNCPALARYLKSVGTDCLGSLRSDRRHVPADIDVNYGITVVRHCGDVSITAWRDVRPVTMISTYHTENVSKKSDNSERPAIFKTYNTIMRALDVKNRKLSASLSERKASKWYIKMFKRLLNASVHNAFVMLRSSLRRRGLAPVKSREFRHELADSMARRHRRGPGPAGAGPGPGPGAGAGLRLRRDVVHTPRTQSGRNSRKRCLVCYRRGTYKLVHSQCATCQEFVCFERCWAAWHELPALPERPRSRRARTHH